MTGDAIGLDAARRLLGLTIEDLWLTHIGVSKVAFARWPIGRERHELKAP